MILSSALVAIFFIIGEASWFLRFRFLDFTVAANSSVIVSGRFLFFLLCLWLGRRLAVSRLIVRIFKIRVFTLLTFIATATALRGLQRLEKPALNSVVSILLQEYMRKCHIYVLATKTHFRSYFRTILNVLPSWGFGGLIFHFPNLTQVGPMQPSPHPYLHQV